MVILLVGSLPGPYSALGDARGLQWTSVWNPMYVCMCVCMYVCVSVLCMYVCVHTLSQLALAPFGLLWDSLCFSGLC